MTTTTEGQPELLTDEDLAAIEQRRAYVFGPDHDHDGWHDAITRIARDDVPRLIADLRALHQSLDEVRTAITGYSSGEGKWVNPYTTLDRIAAAVVQGKDGGK